MTVGNNRQTARREHVQRVVSKASHVGHHLVPSLSTLSVWAPNTLTHYPVCAHTLHYNTLPSVLTVLLLCVCWLVVAENISQTDAKGFLTSLYCVCVSVCGCLVVAENISQTDAKGQYVPSTDTWR